MEEVPKVERGWKGAGLEDKIHLLKICPEQCISAVVTISAKIIGGKKCIH